MLKNFVKIETCPQKIPVLYFLPQNICLPNKLVVERKALVSKNFYFKSAPVFLSGDLPFIKN